MDIFGLVQTNHVNKSRKSLTKRKKASTTTMDNEYWTEEAMTTLKNIMDEEASDADDEESDAEETFADDKESDDAEETETVLPTPIFRGKHFPMQFSDDETMPPPGWLCKFCKHNNLDAYKTCAACSNDKVEESFGSREVPTEQREQAPSLSSREVPTRQQVSDKAPSLSSREVPTKQQVSDKAPSLPTKQRVSDSPQAPSLSTTPRGIREATKAYGRVNTLPTQSKKKKQLGVPSKEKAAAMKATAKSSQAAPVSPEKQKEHKKEDKRGDKQPANTPCRKFSDIGGRGCRGKRNLWYKTTLQFGTMLTPPPVLASGDETDDWSPVVVGSIIINPFRFSNGKREHSDSEYLRKPQVLIYIPQLEHNPEYHEKACAQFKTAIKETVDTNFEGESSHYSCLLTGDIDALQKAQDDGNIKKFQRAKEQVKKRGKSVSKKRNKNIDNESSASDTEIAPRKKAVKKRKIIIEQDDGNESTDSENSARKNASKKKPSSTKKKPSSTKKKSQKTKPSNDEKIAPFELAVHEALDKRDYQGGQAWMKVITKLRRLDEMIHAAASEEDFVEAGRLQETFDDHVNKYTNNLD